MQEVGSGTPKSVRDAAGRCRFSCAQLSPPRLPPLAANLVGLNVGVNERCGARASLSRAEQAQHIHHQHRRGLLPASTYSICVCQLQRSRSLNGRVRLCSPSFWCVTAKSSLGVKPARSESLGFWHPVTSCLRTQHACCGCCWFLALAAARTFHQRPSLCDALRQTCISSSLRAFDHSWTFLGESSLQQQPCPQAAPRVRKPCRLT